MAHFQRHAFKGKTYPSGNQSIYIILQMSLSKKVLFLAFLAEHFVKVGERKIVR
jgi:hypothetical protein